MFHDKLILYFIFTISATAILIYKHDHKSIIEDEIAVPYFATG